MKVDDLNLPNKLVNSKCFLYNCPLPSFPSSDSQATPSFLFSFLLFTSLVLTVCRLACVFLQGVVTPLVPLNILYLFHVCLLHFLMSKFDPSQRYLCVPPSSMPVCDIQSMPLFLFLPASFVCQRHCSKGW